jgi:hypothetical protein
MPDVALENIPEWLLGGSELSAAAAPPEHKEVTLPGVVGDHMPGVADSRSGRGTGRSRTPKSCAGVTLLLLGITLAMRPVSASSAAAPAMCAMMVAIEPSASSRNSGSVWGGSNQGSLQTARVLTAPSPPPLSFLILSQSGEWPERETRSGKKKPQNRPGLSLPEGTNA